MTKAFPQTRAYPELWPAVNVADIDLVEGAMGPGLRRAVWVQGCGKRCPGCINPAFLSLHRHHPLMPRELLTRVDAVPGLAGITLSGGEPVLQAEALVPFLAGVRNRGLSVVCYTGYDLEELTGDGTPRPLADFLAHVDLLIAGPYQRELPRAGPFLESANQRLHFLGDRVRAANLHDQPAHQVVLGGREAHWTGPLPEGIFRQLAVGLEQLGVRVNPPRRPRPSGLQE